MKKFLYIPFFTITPPQGYLTPIPVSEFSPNPTWIKNPGY
jgi:hypothetical protein